MPISTWLAGALLMTKSKRCSSCLAVALGMAIFNGGNSASLIAAGVGGALASAVLFSVSFILLSVVLCCCGSVVAQALNNIKISNGDNRIGNVCIILFSLTLMCEY